MALTAEEEAQFIELEKEFGGLSAEEESQFQELELEFGGNIDVVSPETPTDPTFLENVGDRLMERADNMSDMQESFVEGEQSRGEAGAQIIGQGAAAAFDIAGEGISSLAETGFEALSEDTQGTLKEFGSDILNSDFAQAGLEALGEGATQYEEWAAKNKRLAHNLEAAGNIGVALLPLNVKIKGKLKPVGGGGKGIKAAMAVATSPIRNKVISLWEKKGAVVDGELKPGKLSKAEKKVYTRLRKDFRNDDDGFEAAIGDYVHSDMALVEAGGKRVGGLAEISSQLPLARGVAEDFFEEALEGAPSRIKAAAAEHVGPEADFFDAIDQITKSGRKKVSPDYDKAFGANQAMQSDRLNQIFAGSDGKPVLNKAIKQLEASLIKDPTNVDLVDSIRYLQDFVSGKGDMPALPLQAFDEIKQSLDKVIYDKKGVMKDTAGADNLEAIRYALVDELDKLDETGSYKKARAGAEGYITNKIAAEKGLKFLTDDSMVVKRYYNSLGDTGKASYKVGVMESIRKKMSNINDGSATINFLTKNQSARESLELILTKREYAGLIKEADAVKKLYSLKDQIVGGSPSGRRVVGVAAEGYEAVVEDTLSSMTMFGATASGLMAGKKIVKRLYNGLSDKAAEDVVKILFEKNPVEKLRIAKKFHAQAKKGKNPIGETEAGRKLEAYFMLERLPEMIREHIEAQDKQITGGAGIDDLEGGQGDDVLNDGPPADAIEILRGNSDLAGEFDAAFGEGAADRALNQKSIVPDTLVEDEGLVQNAYKDTLGNTTVGIGFNMDSGIAQETWKRAGVKSPFKDVYNGKAGITEDESFALAELGSTIAQEDAQKFIPRFRRLTPARQDAITNLSYQMGYPTLSKFTKFRKAMLEENYRLAARELVLSQWYKQTQPDRKNRILRQIITGE